MAMQQTNSNFAKKLGGRVAQANAEHKDKPIDTGMRRLPAGIKSGIAKLQFMYTKEQTEEKGKDAKIPKGEHFFRGSAVVLGKVVNGVLVKDHNGENIEGLTTQVVIPLCDVAGKNGREGKSFSENWYEFQNIFKLLSNGSIVCQESAQSDPTGQKTEAFYFTAMSALTNPKHPVYVEFSTREWTPPATMQQPKPEPMVFETWHGLAQLPSNGRYDPAAGVTQAPSGATATNTSHPTDPPSSSVPPQHRRAVTAAEKVATEAEVTGLVEVAMSDPNSETPDGAAATTQLEEMAWANGWTKEQTMNAKDWSEVGRMALSQPSGVIIPPTTITAPISSTPLGPDLYAVGRRWMYAKRTKEGVKYKNNKGEDFPPQECEIVTVNMADKTCTLKTIHDGKDVVDIRTKAPVAVKFEWLENAPPY